MTGRAWSCSRGLLHRAPGPVFSHACIFVLRTALRSRIGTQHGEGYSTFPAHPLSTLEPRLPALPGRMRGFVWAVSALRSLTRDEVLESDM